MSKKKSKTRKKNIKLTDGGYGACACKDNTKAIKDLWTVTYTERETTTIYEKPDLLERAWDNLWLWRK